MSEKDYTFIVSPKAKVRYDAGPYNQKAQSPRYTIEALVPSDVKNQIVFEQFLMGREGSRVWVWDIINNSELEACIRVKKDGELVPYLYNSV